MHAAAPRCERGLEIADRRQRLIVNARCRQARPRRGSGSRPPPWPWARRRDAPCPWPAAPGSAGEDQAGHRRRRHQQRPGLPIGAKIIRRDDRHNAGREPRAAATSIDWISRVRVRAAQEGGMQQPGHSPRRPRTARGRSAACGSSLRVTGRPIWRVSMLSLASAAAARAPRPRCADSRCSGTDCRTVPGAPRLGWDRAAARGKPSASSGCRACSSRIAAPCASRNACCSGCSMPSRAPAPRRCVIAWPSACTAKIRQARTGLRRRTGWCRRRRRRARSRHGCRSGRASWRRKSLSSRRGSTVCR